MNIKGICKAHFFPWIISVVFLFPFLVFADESPLAIEYESGFYYTVKTGDTLSGISSRFLGSPLLWPDLWSENRQIKNPYQIRPGDRIRLFRHAGVQKIEKAAAGQKSISEKAGPYYLYAGIDSVGFMRQAPLTPWGAIFKVVGGKKIISDKDHVFIWQTADGSLKTGSRYTVYRTLKDKNDKGKNPRLGTQYYLTGIVEVIESKPRFAYARVVHAFRAIEINDRVMSYEKRSPKIPLVKSKAGLFGNIIGSEEHRVNFGDHAIAFIDKGEADGVSRGQIYHIFRQEKAIDPKTKSEVTLTPLDFGSFLVLSTDKTTATVLIIQSDEAVNPGDRFRSPPDQ